VTPTLARAQACAAGTQALRWRAIQAGLLVVAPRRPPSLAPSAMAFLTPSMLPSLPARGSRRSRCTVRALVPAGADVSDARPVRDRLLVRVSQNETVTAGGLVLATDSLQRPKTGVILAVPPGANKVTKDVFAVGETVMWRHDYVAEVVQNNSEGEDGGRIVSVRAGNVCAKW
jgi:co-chaperonin GroES (HSP10)